MNDRDQRRYDAAKRAGTRNHHCETVILEHLVSPGWRTSRRTGTFLAIVLVFSSSLTGVIRAADETPAAESELAQLRRENEQLKKKLAEAEGRARKSPNDQPTPEATAHGRKSATGERAREAIALARHLLRKRPPHVLVEAGDRSVNLPRPVGRSAETAPDRPAGRSFETAPEPTPTVALHRYSVSALQENVARKTVTRFQKVPDSAATADINRSRSLREDTSSPSASGSPDVPPLPESDARGFLFPDDAPYLEETAPALSLEDTPAVVRSVRTTFARAYLRKGIFTKDGIGGISDPAEITYVHPGKGKDSYSINAGLGAFWDTQLAPDNQLQWGLGVEYHRNTDVADRKNDLVLGPMYTWTIGDTKLEGANLYFVRVAGSTTFKNHNIENFHAVASNLDIFPVFGAAYIDQWIIIHPGKIPLRWQPFAGLSYEGTTATADGIQGGQRLVIRAGVQLEIFPLQFCLGQTVQLVTGFTTRWAPASTGIYEADKGWNGYFHADLTYWFRDEAVAINQRLINFGFGLSYVKGDDPEQGLRDQDLLTLSFKTRY